MFSIIKKLFGKAQPDMVAPLSVATLVAEPSTPMPSVEVVHLSLAAIASSFPEELRGTVLHLPEPEVTVALPLPTIMKQLPVGVVKMSLASLHRQAPEGTFAPLPVGDRRMVNVPLGEVFLHVHPSTLPRRLDQRPAFVPDANFNLFGNTANPFEISAPPVSDVLEIEESHTQMRDLQQSARALSGVNSERPSGLEPPPTAGGQRVIAPPADYFQPTLRPLTLPTRGPTPVATPVIPPKKLNLPPLVLPIQPLAADWPEAVRRELAPINGSATVTLPSDEVGAALAKGKISFTWGEIRAWTEPGFTEPTAVNADTPLLLPLKVVAPAFLAVSRQPRSEKANVLDEAIPALFVNAQARLSVPEPAIEEFVTPPESLPSTETVIATDAGEAPELIDIPEPLVARETAPAFELIQTPERGEEEEVFTPAPEAEQLNTLPELATSEKRPLPTPIEEETTADGATSFQTNAPITLKSLFGLPGKESWSPGELVANVVKLPDVMGAVIGLHEGLPVAHSLPEHVKAETVTAFLPQIFARLNQYAGEMNLGEVDDLLLTTRGASFQIKRLGQIYFAVLGKPGAALPTRELSLVADELAKHSENA